MIPTTLSLVETTTQMDTGYFQDASIHRMKLFLYKMPLEKASYSFEVHILTLPTLMFFTAVSSTKSGNIPRQCPNTAVNNLTLSSARRESCPV